MENLTGAEKVLYKHTYEFYLNVFKASHEEAVAAAEAKINQKRDLGKKLKFKY
jgi:hypothetical protein